MENQSPILRYLSTAYREQTPVMSNTDAYVSRLTIIAEDPLLFEVDLTIGPDRVRTYAIQKQPTVSTENPFYQVAPVHQGTTGSFSKLSESDLYYMITGKSLTDEE
ncbi:hypothetical protein [Spirosoma radiotolerans]|uniref:Uncharacterized protein n=1 Tax=Spirosoma radiotolerans TaxID=1379870 RepID=A0A0E3ZZK3_9BACT|nr:hypothetical protein [Spirosoma radiotolerans]AKD57415.1 hypothetical protein SD10_23525 [Spirosoma radiotolerans]